MHGAALAVYRRSAHQHKKLAVRTKRLHMCEIGPLKTVGVLTALASLYGVYRPSRLVPITDHCRLDVVPLFTIDCRWTAKTGPALNTLYSMTALIA